MRSSRLSLTQGGQSWEVTSETITIGRCASSLIPIDCTSVSWEHAELSLLQPTPMIRDLESTNGTFVNSKKLESNVWCPVENGDIIQVGRFAFTVSVVTLQRKETEDSLVILHSERTLIGRDPECDWPVSNQQASWHHCELLKKGDQVVVRDLDSTNGTYINGERIREQNLELGDELSISGLRLTYVSSGTFQFDSGAKGRLDVISLFKRIPQQEKLLIDNVSFTVEPGNLVAIVGASGAGKTSLLNAVTGFKMAESGWVLYDGLDHETHFEDLKTSIGYVPQDDVIPLGLTVERVLWHAARLRLPQDTTRDEILTRIDHVLNELNLSHRATTIVNKLSGGERKRVNVAVELLGSPRFLFLDEPTTGLDPGTERQMMVLLKRLCSEGRTIILVTHATENISLCDKVMFLAAGGIPAFYGHPNEVGTYFGVSDFAEAYTDIQSAEDPEQLRADIAIPEPPLGQSLEHRLAGEQGRESGYHKTLISQLGEASHQLRILSAKYIEEVLSDRRNLLLLLAQAPIIGILTSILFRSDTFAASQTELDGGHFPIQAAPTLLFLIALTCIWCGATNALRELVKESRMFARERMANLQIAPYLMSKVAILGLLCIIQSVVLWWVLSVGVGFHGLSAQGNQALVAWMVVCSVCAMVLGLLISALAKSSDQAGSILPILLVPQVLLGGLLVPLEEMPVFGRALADVSPSRWGFSGLASILELETRFAKVGLDSLVKESFRTPISESITGIAALSFAFLVSTGAILWYSSRRRI